MAKEDYVHEGSVCEKRMKRVKGVGGFKLRRSLESHLPEGELVGDV